MAEITAGADIDSYCGKCKLFLAHVIVAVKAGSPAQVECKTCRAVHGYRPDPPGAKRAKDTKNPRKKRSSTRVARRKMTEYERAMKGRDPSDAIKYSLAADFEKGGLLLHKNFGVGLVIRLLGPHKIEVLFEEGVKLLVHRRA